jgi:hypothetical protein
MYGASQPSTSQHFSFQFTPRTQMGDTTIPCRYCGDFFEKGWTLQNHSRACREISASIRGLSGDSNPRLTSELHTSQFGADNDGGDATDDNASENDLQDVHFSDDDGIHGNMNYEDMSSDDEHFDDNVDEADPEVVLYHRNLSLSRDAYRLQFLRAYLELLPRHRNADGTHSGRGRLRVDSFQTVTIQFLCAMATGEGMSKRQQGLMLRFCHGLEGDGLLLPASVDGCWKLVSQLHVQLVGPRGQRSIKFPIPAEIRAFLVHPLQTEIEFNCEDIIRTMVRLLSNNALSKPHNMQLQYEEGNEYSDFCHGDRFKRTQAAIGSSKAILCFTLFIDGLIIDKAGFKSTKGCVLTCGNYRKHIRGSSDTKARICSFPTLKFAYKHVPDVAKNWMKGLFHECIRFMLAPVHDFNTNGGAIIPIDGTPIDFGRALIVALYTDCPEGDSLGLVGSACHRCYVAKTEMGDVNAREPERTEENMETHKTRLNGELIWGQLEVTRAEAKRLGVNLTVLNGFLHALGKIGLFGPCPLRDHLWGALQQGMLHGFHEGVLVKVLYLTIMLCRLHKGTRSEKAVDLIIDEGFVDFYRLNPRNSNVEHQEHASWHTFAHGIVHYLTAPRRLNGTYYSPMLRQMHAIIVSHRDLLPYAVFKPLCEVYDLVYKVEASLTASVSKGEGITQFQDLVTEMMTKLIVLFMPLSASDCQSKKMHLPLHWGEYLRDIGCSADEKLQEKELGILFKKPIKYTNSATASLDEQVGNRVWDKVMLRGVAYDIGVSDTLFMKWHGLDVNAEIQRDGYVQPRLRPQKSTAEVSLLGNDHRDASGEYRVGQIYPAPEKSIAKTVFEFGDPIVGAHVLERARGKILTGDLVQPLRIAPQCSMSLWNPVGGSAGAGMFVPVTFRATETFRGMPWYDNVRVTNGVDGDDVRWMVGQCLCFIEDDNNNMNVAIRWYQDGETRHPEDVDTKLCEMTLMPRSNIASYDIFPVTQIVNGAMLLPSLNPRKRTVHYLVQTPREQKEHNRRSLVDFAAPRQASSSGRGRGANRHREPVAMATGASRGRSGSANGRRETVTGAARTTPTLPRRIGVRQSPRLH